MLHDVMRKTMFGVICALLVVAGALIALWRSETLPTGGISESKTESAQSTSSATITLSGTRIAVEIVDTPATRRQGLSDRRELASGAGMLFVFEKPDYHGFWMKNMRFPLDIIWFSEQRKAVDMVTFAKPESASPKKIYSPREKALYGLEVNAGFVKEEGIVRGDEFSFVK